MTSGYVDGSIDVQNRESSDYESVTTRTSSNNNDDQTLSENSFIETTSLVYSQSGSSASTLTQRGTYSEGNYAFSSLVYQQQEESAVTSTEDSISSFSSTGTTSSNGSGSYGTSSWQSSTVGGVTGVSTYSHVNEWTNSSAGTFSQNGHTTSGVQAFSYSSSTLYQAGQSALGSTSLSCIVLTQISVETVSSQMVTTMAQSGGNSTTTSNTHTTGGAGGDSVWSEGYLDYASSTQFSSSTINRNSVATTSLLQEGARNSQGTYNLSNIVLNTDAVTSQSSHEEQTESFSQGSEHSRTIGTLYSSTSLDSQYTRTYASENESHSIQSQETYQSGVVEISVDNETETSSSYRAQGSFSGETNRYTLTDVSYDVQATSTYSASQSSNVTTTGGNFSRQYDRTQSFMSMQDANGSALNESSAATYNSIQTDFEQHSVTTQTSQGTSHVRYYQGGSLTDEVYAFTSVVYDSTAHSASTMNTTSTNSSTQTSVESTTRSDTNTGVSNYGYFEPNAARNGSGYSLMTTVTEQTGSGGCYAYSHTTVQLYEAGSSDAMGMQFSSVVYSEDTADQSGNEQSSLATQVVSRSTGSNDSYFEISNPIKRFTGLTVSYSVATATVESYSSIDHAATSHLYESGASSGCMGMIALETINSYTDGQEVLYQYQQQSQNSIETTYIESTTTPITTAVPVHSYMTNVAANHAESTQVNDSTFGYTVNRNGAYADGYYAFGTVEYSESFESTQSFNSASAGTYTSLATGTNYRGNATSTQSGSVDCWQHTADSVYALGTSASGEQSLSCYVLNSVSMQSATKASNHGKSSTYEGWNDQGYPFSGSNSATESRTDKLWQLNNLHEEGQFVDNRFSLSAINFINIAQYTTTYYHRGNENSSSSVVIASDSYTVNASANGSYAATGLGSLTQNSSGHDVLTFSSYSFTGGSAASYNLAQTGSVSGDSGGTYSHVETQNANTSVSIHGRYDHNYTIGAVTWTFSDYNVATNADSFFNETVRGKTSTANLYRTTVLSGTGSGADATLVESGNGTLTLSGHGTSSFNGSKSSPAELTRPPLYWRWPTIAGAGNFTVDRDAPLPRALRGINGLLETALMPAMLGPRMMVPVHSYGAPTAMPRLMRYVPSENGNSILLWNVSHEMLTPSWVSPYSPETALQTANWGLVNTAFTDAMNRAPWIHSRGGLDLFGKNEFTGEASRVNATITGDLENNLAQAMDFLAGVANVTTGGLSLRLLNALGVGYLIDTSSTAFAVGQIAGVVVLMVLPGGGVIGTTVMAMQVAGSLWNAYDAFRAGDFVGGSIQLAFAAIGGARLASSLGITSRVGSMASNAASYGTGLVRNLGGAAGAQMLNGAATIGNGIGRIGVAIGNGIHSGGVFLSNVGGRALGNAFVRDALIGGGLGAIGYTASTGLSSAISGRNEFSLGGLLGAVLGGAAAGATYRYFANNAGRFPGLVGGLSGAVGGMVGGSVTSFVDQWTHNGFNNINYWDVAAHGGVGGLSGLVGGAVGGRVMGSNPHQAGWVRLLGGGTLGGMAGGAVGGGFGAAMNGENTQGIAAGAGWGSLFGGFGGFTASASFGLGRAGYNRWGTRPTRAPYENVDTVNIGGPLPGERADAPGVVHVSLEPGPNTIVADVNVVNLRPIIGHDVGTLTATNVPFIPVPRGHVIPRQFVVQAHNLGVRNVVIRTGSLPRNVAAIRAALESGGFEIISITEVEGGAVIIEARRVSQ